MYIHVIDRYPFFVLIDNLSDMIYNIMSKTCDMSLKTLYWLMNRSQSGFLLMGFEHLTSTWAAPCALRMVCHMCGGVGGRGKGVYR